jgi:hypothetical protein
MLFKLVSASGEFLQHEFIPTEAKFAPLPGGPRGGVKVTPRVEAVI